MAERKRRGKNAADENLDEVLDDAVDALDDDDDDEDRAPVSNRRGGATAVKTRRSGVDHAKKVSEKAETRDAKAKSDERVGIFARFWRFFREVVSELRKVIWPTRKELITYATVVLVFVAIMLTIVGLLDLGFAKAVLFVFGGGTKQ